MPTDVLLNRASDGGCRLKESPDDDAERMDCFRDEHGSMTNIYCEGLELLARRDLHVHTMYCLHAEGTMEDYVLSAIDRGLEEIGFLAHAEAGIESPRRRWLSERDLDDYWEEGRNLQEQYGNRIRVTLGLELGLNPDALPALMCLIERHPWDRIGLSYHHLPYGASRLNICSRASIPRLMEVDPLEMAIRYYSDLRDHISIIRPAFLCHLDVVRKFMEDRSEHPRVRRLITQVLQEMRNAGVSLEVNTAGYFTVGNPYPAARIVREAVEMGIDLVLCSDSHKPQHIAKDFDKALSYIRHSLNGRS